MKINLPAVIFFGLFLLSCDKKEPQLSDIVEREPQTQTKEIKMDFDAITVSAGIDAEVIKSAEEKVIISAPANLLDKVEVINESGKLVIRMKPAVNISLNNLHAKIYAKDFTAIEANSSAVIVIKEKFIQDDTAVSVSSSGRINGELEANRLTVNASSSGSFSGRIWAVDLVSNIGSSGEVSVKGKAKNAAVVSNSSGTFNGFDLMVENAQLSASSSGDVSVSVSSSLVANADSSGTVRVRKIGKITRQAIQENSGGSVSIN